MRYVMPENDKDIVAGKRKDYGSIKQKKVQCSDVAMSTTKSIKNNNNENNSENNKNNEKKTKHLIFAEQQEIKENKEIEEQMSGNVLNYDFGSMTYFQHDNQLSNIGIDRNLSKEQRHLLTVSLAKYRGTRLRLLRNILYMTINEFAILVQVKPTSLGRIERGETCLTVSFAKWVSQKCSAELNIAVSAKWLLSGDGIGPRVTDDKNKNKVQHCNKSNLQNIDENIWINIHQQFVAHYKERAVTCFVKDNHMFPLYKKGFVVGGISLPRSHWNKIRQTPVILGMRSSDMFVRFMHWCSDNQVFILSSYDYKYPPKILHTYHISFVAQIMWYNVSTNLQ